MEESKYYTPEIEEFFVGFEFECHNQMEFEKMTFGVNDFSNPELRQYKDDIMKAVHAICRVKFLDREDIESLGWSHAESIRWKLVDRDDVFTIPYKDPRGFCNEMSLLYAPLTSWVLICQYNNKNTTDESVTRFTGRVKNKSELRKLMKMLQITK